MDSIFKVILGVTGRRHDTSTERQLDDFEINRYIRDSEPRLKPTGTFAKCDLVQSLAQQLNIPPDVVRDILIVEQAWRIVLECIIELDDESRAVNGNRRQTLRYSLCVLGDLPQDAPSDMMTHGRWTVNVNRLTDAIVNTFISLGLFV